MQLPHYNVVFATPGREMTAGYVKSLLKTIKILDKEGISWTYVSEYSSLVSHAREATASSDRMLKAKDQRLGQGKFTYDKVMWIDSDIEWEPIDFFKLYDSNKDIVSGCYVITDGSNHSIAAYKEPYGAGISVTEIHNYFGVIEVYATGFGFICMKNGVFESIERPWFSQENLVEINKDTQQVDIKKVIVGEDLSWCIKAQNTGYKIYLDTSVQVTHVKSMKIHPELFKNA